MKITPRVIWISLAIVILALAACLLMVGYWPSLGHLVGLGTPRDLGVTFTEEDYTNAHTKLFGSDNPLEVSDSFTDAEMSALLNSCTGGACLLRDVQVRTDSNDRVAISGSIQKDKISEAMLANGVDPALNSLLLYLPAEAPFYAEVEVQGQDDVLVLELMTAQLSGFGMPAEILREINAELSQSLNEYLAALPGTQITNIHVQNGSIQLNADLSEIQL
ncbi:MAG: hypothetical protein QG626_301 [Patescibacteria group bacterium]|nr:hypothetical protein [Patescibacteria group bacterium]